MKAVIWTQYGPPDVLQPAEVDTPAPKDDQVLIRVRATTATAGDCELRAFDFPPWLWVALRPVFGLREPKRVRILGQDCAGVVEAVGGEVTRLRVGDHVFAVTGLRFGGYAEYVCLPARGPIATMPDRMTFEEAAPLATWASNALHFLRMAAIRPGETVLIVGAAGSIGTYAVQIAKSLGAKVIAVDRREKLDALLALGADGVIDHERENFTERKETYDVIFDVVGRSDFARSVRSLAPGGRYLLANTHPLGMLRALWTSMTTDKHVFFRFASPNERDLVAIRELVEAGKLRSVLDRRFPLEEAAEAHRYVETGQKVGNVVIVPQPGPVG